MDVVEKDGSVDAVRLAVLVRLTEALFVTVPEPVEVLDWETDAVSVTVFTAVLEAAIDFVLVPDTVELLDCVTERVCEPVLLIVFDIDVERDPVADPVLVAVGRPLPVVDVEEVRVALPVTEPVVIAVPVTVKEVRAEPLPDPVLDALPDTVPDPVTVREPRTDTDTEAEVEPVFVRVIDLDPVGHDVGVFVLAPDRDIVAEPVDVRDCVVDRVFVLVWATVGDWEPEAVAVRVCPGERVEEPVAVFVLDVDMLFVPAAVDVDVREDVVVAVEVRVIAPVLLARTDLDADGDDVLVLDTVMDRETEGDADADLDGRVDPVLVPVELGEREEVVDPVLVLEDVDVFVLETEDVLVRVDVCVAVWTGLAVVVLEKAGVRVVMEVPRTDRVCLLLWLAWLLWAADRVLVVVFVDVLDAVPDADGRTCSCLESVKILTDTSAFTECISVSSSKRSFIAHILYMVVYI